MQPDQRVSISVRLIPAVYTDIRINITQGDLMATVTINRADIHHPHPFDDDGLTADCRSFIVQAVRCAIAQDGHDRRINWPT